MSSAREKPEAQETWRPGRLLSDVAPRDQLGEEDDEFEAVPPSRHDQPTRRGSFRVPMLLVPKF